MHAVGSRVRMRNGGRALLVTGLFLGMTASLRAEDGAPAAQANLPAMVGQPIPGQSGLRWRYAEVMIEWGFQKGREEVACDGSIESTYDVGLLGAARPLDGDKQTEMTGERAWRSPGGGSGRRGIVVPVLYSPAVRGPARTILTLRTSAGSFSSQPVDLRAGPILVSELGFFIRDQAPPRAESPAVPPILPANELLKEELNDGGVRGWGPKETPVIYAYPADEPLKLLNGAIVIPPQTVVAHPGAGLDIAIGWRSLFTGKVNLRAKLTHGHRGGGDGVTWTVVHQGKKARTVLAQGVVDSDGSQSIPAEADAGKLTGVAVEEGDGLVLDIGPRGNHHCDTTFVELTITEAGGAGRTWDLAKDVLNDIHAANPHADSLGNAGVWHFLAPHSENAPQGWVPQVAKMTLPFESKATTAREFLDELAQHKPQTLRQRVRALPEQTWQKAMEAIHGKREWPPFPTVPYEPNMQVEVPDKHLTALWKIGAWQIMKYGGPGEDGKYYFEDHPFGLIAVEEDRMFWALDQMGMHKAAADGMGVWLDRQQEDGMLITDHPHDRMHAAGALAIPWVMVDHYWLTGDQEWLKAQAPRLKAAAQWIVKRRGNGLQPRIAWGDGDVAGAIPWILTDTLAYQSVARIAAALAEIDPQASAELAAEAEKYRAEIRKTFDEALARNPVIRTWDGTCRSFLAPVYQERGPRSQALPETANLLSHCGSYSCDIVTSSAAIESCLRSGLFPADDPRLDGHFEVLEDVFLRTAPWVANRKKDYSPDRDWFDFGWGYQSGWERLPDCYLYLDDVPNFIRAWLNRCAVDLNLSNNPVTYTFNEHTFFNHNDKSHGNAVFLSNFRNMLAMEIGDALWLARATPRAWLEQGKKISVKNAPTYFGTLAYEIVSDVDNGKINATVEIPARKAPQTVVLRLRHPKASPIKSATVNGKDWKNFDQDRETIELTGQSGTVAVAAKY